MSDMIGRHDPHLGQMSSTEGQSVSRRGYEELASQIGKTYGPEGGPIIDVPAPNPVLRYLRDALTSPYVWGLILMAFLVKIIVTSAPWQAWAVGVLLTAVAIRCTRSLGRWRNPNPPADPGWGVRSFMILAYLAAVGLLLLWAVWMT